MLIHVRAVAQAMAAVGGGRTVEAPDGCMLYAFLPLIGLSRAAPYLYVVNGLAVHGDMALHDGDELAVVPLLEAG